ncbi:MAG: hypothetical protein KF773_22245 [Deltaproteobacteria bacterium]|nr:hypothetical protein [Deltaproteobacteria bacterium]
MMKAVRVAGFVLGVVAVACAGCAAEHGSLLCPRTGLADLPESCLAALVFANRDTSELIASQDEVDRYFDRWRRLVAAEPVLFRRRPQSHRMIGGYEVADVDVSTASAAIHAAWKQAAGQDAIPITGDAAFDAVIAELYEPHHPRVLRIDGDEPGVKSVIFSTRSRFNEEILHARLAAVGASLPDVIQWPNDDGVWRWQGASGSGSDDATAEIQFTFGWNDCFSGCGAFHSIHAIVPPTGRPEVFDLGGAPLPPGLELSPNTRPPP